MSWRTVVIATQSKLDYKMGYLVVRSIETKRVLLDEIATLVLENPAVSITGCLISELIQRKVKVIFCDEKRNPTAELIPHHGSHDSTAKIRTQIEWGEEIKGLVWRDIICEKIKKQAHLLEINHKSHEASMLIDYVAQVEPLDVTNREGHAAKVYFNALFGMDFTRSADIPTNAALNYGYSLLLSAFNREISANGYLTQLGIFHDNMFNHFNLGSDMMEPFRVLVDRHVIDMKPEQFQTDEKHEMWKVLSENVAIDGGKQSVSNAIRIYSRSVFDALNDGDTSLIKFYSMEN